MPAKYIIKSGLPTVAEQMDGNIYSYTEMLRPNSKIIFETNYGFKEYTLPHKKTFVRNLNLTKIDFVLRLRLCLTKIS